MNFLLNGLENIHASLKLINEQLLKIPKLDLPINTWKWGLFEFDKDKYFEFEASKIILLKVKLAEDEVKPNDA